MIRTILNLLRRRPDKPAPLPQETQQVVSALESLRSRLKDE